MHTKDEKLNTTQAASESSAWLGDHADCECCRKAKYRDIQRGIDYGVLRDAFDTEIAKVDRYRKALIRVSNESAEAAICAIADEALNDA